MKVLKKKLTTEEQLMWFLGTLQELEPVEFIGLAKILCIPLMQDGESGAPVQQRPAEEILVDMVDRYLSLKPRVQKDIDKLLKEIKKENGRNKVTTRHSKHSS